MTLLRPPCCLGGVLDGASVAMCQVGDDHYVLEVPGWHVEGGGELAHDRVAVAGIGADRQVGAVELPRDQPAVVARLGQCLWRGVRRTLTSVAAGRATSPISARALLASAWPGWLPPSRRRRGHRGPVRPVPVSI